MAYEFNPSAWDEDQEKRRKQFATEAITQSRTEDAGKSYGESLTLTEQMSAAARAEWSTLAVIDKAREYFADSAPHDANFVVTPEMVDEQVKGLSPEGAKAFRTRALKVTSAYEFGNLRSRIIEKETDENILQHGSSGVGLRMVAAATDPLQVAAGGLTGLAIGSARVGGTLTRMGVGGLAAVGSTLPSELLLQDQNPLRSHEDLAWAIGVPLAAGAAFGAFTKGSEHLAKNSTNLAKSEELLRKQKWAASGIDSAPKADDIVTYNLNGAEYPIKVTGVSPEDGRIFGTNIFTNAEVTIEAGAARAPSAEVSAKVDEWVAVNKKAAEDAYKADALKMVQESDAAAKAQKAKEDVMAGTIARAQQGRAHNTRQKDLEAAFNGNITDHTKLAVDPVRTGSGEPKVLDVAGEKLSVSTPASIMRKGGADRVAQLLNTVGEMQSFTKRKLDAGMEAIRTKGAQRTRMELLTALMKKADNVALDVNETALLKEFPTMEAFDAARRPVQSASDDFINKLLGKSDAPAVKNADIAVENVRARPKDAPGVGFGKADEVTPDGGIIVSPRRKKAAKAKAEPKVKPTEKPEVKVVDGADPVVTKAVDEAAVDVPQAIRKEAIQEGDHVEFSKVNKDGEEEFFSGRVTGVGNYIVVKTVDGTKSAKLENITKHTSNAGLFRKATAAERLGGEGLLSKVDDTVDEFAGLDERAYSNPMLNATESPAVRAIGEALDGSTKLADDLMSACELARTAGADTGKATRKTKKK